MITKARNITRNRNGTATPHAAAAAADSERSFHCYRTFLFDTFSAFNRGLNKRNYNLFDCHPLILSQQMVSTHRRINNVITGHVRNQRFCFLIKT